MHRQIWWVWWLCLKILTNLQKIGHKDKTFASFKFSFRIEKLCFKNLLWDHYNESHRNTTKRRMKVWKRPYVLWIRSQTTSNNSGVKVTSNKNWCKSTEMESPVSTARKDDHLFLVTIHVIRTHLKVVSALYCCEKWCRSDVIANHNLLWWQWRLYFNPGEEREGLSR